MSQAPSGKTNPQKKPPAIVNYPKYKELLEAIDYFSPHPKVKKLKSSVLEHFCRKVRRVRVTNPRKRTRAPGSCGEDIDIVECLNLESPIIKATKFIGQGTDKEGRMGYAQKEQLVVSYRTFSSSLLFWMLTGGGGVLRLLKTLRRANINVYW